MNFKLHFYKRGDEYVLQRGMKQLIVKRDELKRLFNTLSRELGIQVCQSYVSKNIMKSNISSPSILRIYYHLKNNCPEPFGFLVESKYSINYMADRFGIPRTNVPRILSLLIREGCVGSKKAHCAGMMRASKAFFFIRPCRQIEGDDGLAEES